MAETFYHVGVNGYAFETLYDLQNGRYLALGMKNEERKGVDYGFVATSSEYTPTALRQAGVR